jgi:hypothetical protein
VIEAGPPPDEGPAISPTDFVEAANATPPPDAFSAEDPAALGAAEPEPEPEPEAWADEPANLAANAEPPASASAAEEGPGTDDEMVLLPSEPTEGADAWDPEPSQWQDAVEEPAISAQALQALADDPAPRLEDAPSDDRPVYTPREPGFEEDDDFGKPRPIVIDERLVSAANAFGVFLSRALDLLVGAYERVRQTILGWGAARAARRATAVPLSPTAAEHLETEEEPPPVVLESPPVPEAPPTQVLAEDTSWSRQEDEPQRQTVDEDVPMKQRLGDVVSNWARSMRERVEEEQSSRSTPPSPPPRSEPEPPPVSYEVPRKAAAPPPPVSELPVLRLAKIEEPEEPEPNDLYEETTSENRFPTVWPWVKRVAWSAVLVVGGFAAYAGWESWYPKATDLSTAAFTEVSRFAETREQKKRVERALEESKKQLPHLAPDTIQLVLAHSPDVVPDPPEVFQAASNAADRGVSALTPEERQELTTLNREVLRALSPAERERVREYDDVRARRTPFPFEDKSALDLYARGARTLPEESRERLQALVGKAVASGLSSPTADPAPNQPR